MRHKTLSHASSARKSKASAEAVVTMRDGGLSGEPPRLRSRQVTRSLRSGCEVIGMMAGAV